jgi:UDP-N-acetylglucosamine acyltransferase
MANKIHKTAIIEGNVTLGDNIEIGAYTVISGNVKIGNGTKIIAQAHISGNTTIGENNKIFPFASVGTQPQDLKYNGEEVFLEIGNNNTIREHVTINPGTITGAKYTRIGNNCLFMVGAHIAHDCVVGNNVILANNATLAGHVQVGDNAIIGGLSAIHQFVRIGAHAMVGGMSGIENDVIPYGNAFGERASLNGLNLIGLKRRNFSRETIHSLRNAFKDIFEADGKLEEKIKKAKTEYLNNNEVGEIIDFIEKSKDRALCQPKNK